MTVALQTINSFPVAENVLEKIEQVLEHAKSGEVSAVVIVTVERDGSTGRAWSFLHSTATMIGAIEIAKLDILNSHEG